MIRMFQFKNNFLSEDTKMVNAPYSSVGYFDGLDTWVVSHQKGKDVLSIPIRTEKKMDESCDYFNIVGMRHEQDEFFWNENQSQNPFLFVTCIRLHKWSDKFEDIAKTIEKKFDACCYTTFDSSDLIICMRAKSYSQGYSAIEEYSSLVKDLDGSNRIQKSYTILSILQKTLDSLPEENIIGEESVSCLLRCVIKNWDAIVEFEDELKQEIEASKCTSYGTLGSDDWLIILEDIQITNLFRLYGKNSLLTHGHPKYKSAFYNIKTEILVSRERKL